MDKKISYKKCPYCELNYIPIDEVCCKVCYSNFQSARNKANNVNRENNYNDYKKIDPQKLKEERLKKQEEKLRRIQLKEQKEYSDRKELLKLWKSYGFIGFLHTADLKNFILIYKSKFLKSRKQLIKEGINFIDNAEEGVIEKTSETIKYMVRFYYRPITPTNISAYISHNQKNPVLIVFDENIIFDKSVTFCDGCAGSNLTSRTKEAEDALLYDWKEIFSGGAFNSCDFILKNHRNAEFLIKSPLSLEYATKFYFKNYMDYVNACKLFGNDDRFEYNPKLFYWEF